MLRISPRQKQRIKQFLDWLYPPLCLQCHAHVTQNGAVCAECWEKLEFISDPCCSHCGYPFSFETQGASLCGVCIQTPPPYAKARAVLRYSPFSRSLITRLKYADQTQLAVTYGRWLATHGHALVADSDIIVPVPLHYRRFIQRRYNQSALLAAALAKHSALAMLPDGLKRTRHTRPQTTLTRSQRMQNVRNAFCVREQHRDALRGKRVLLIDDVMTTSATIHACCIALEKADVKDVNVLTLARRVS